MSDLELDGFIDYSKVVQPAIYALVYRGVVVYIGKSKVPGIRLGQHFNGTRKTIPGVTKSHIVDKYKMVFDAAWIRPCAASDLDVLERALIKKYSPKYNLNHSAFARSEVSFDALLNSMIPVESQKALVRRF